MNILSVGGTIGSILLFILALSVLIVIHELGHFIVAKSFKVYCSDFSIGFGPKIVKIKRKKGETRFNIGIIPLGGYVSMYGEEGESPDGKNIPKSRSLNGINRWKRAAIMVAGIVMNFILAYIIFFICASCFPQETYYISTPKVTNATEYAKALRVTGEDGKPFEFAGDSDIIGLQSYYIKSEDGKKISKFPQVFHTIETTEVDGKQVEYAVPTYITLTIGTEAKETNFVFTQTYRTPKDCTDIARTIKMYEAKMYDANTIVVIPDNPETKDVNEEKLNDRPIMLPIVDEKKGLIEYKLTDKQEITINTFVLRQIDENKKEHLPLNIKLVGQPNRTIAPLYFGCKKTTKWHGWDSFRVAGVQFADSTTAVAKALGGLLIGQNWDQVGGPLAIFNQTTQILSEYSFSAYLSTWGVISVNLALFNLLPFPGLDGWQLLVTGIEGTVNVFKRAKYRKENEKSNKVKKNSKPETAAENTDKVEETVEVIDSNEGKEVIIPKQKFDKATLLQFSKLNEKISDIERAYFNKFEKKYDHDALLNVFSDPETDYSANEEYKYFKEHNDAVREYDEYVLMNDLKETKPFVEWGIPERIKNIVSYIGLGLLMLLAVVILIMDIIRM